MDTVLGLDLTLAARLFSIATPVAPVALFVAALQAAAL